MTFPIGSSMQAYSPDLDLGKTLAYWTPFSSAAHVVTINNVNDKGRIFEAQQQLKPSLIVARCILTVKEYGQDKELDGALHTKPQGAGDTNYYLVSSENYMNFLEPMAEQKAVLYWGNEPSGEVDTITFDRLVKHTVEGIALADERKYQLCVMNWSVGHPLTIDGKADKRLIPILNALQNARMRHYWGMHLYAPTDTYKAVEALEALCNTEGIEMPPVIITEWGFDAGFAGDPLNGYKTRKINGEQLGDFSLDAVKNKLRRFFENGTIIAIVGFCEGGSPKQEAFNYGNDPGYKNRLVKALQSGEVNLSIKRQTATIPKYYPNIPPLNLEYPHLYKVTLPKGIEYRNVRVLNEEASDDCGKIYDGNLVQIWDSPREMDNLMRHWQYCEIVSGLSAGQKGWLFIDGIQLTPTLPQDTPKTTTEVPVVIVPPAPAPVVVPPLIPPPPVSIPAGCLMSSDQLATFAEKLKAFEAAAADLRIFIESLVPKTQPKESENVLVPQI